MSAGEIAERVGIAPAALSFHLKELAHARLVKARQDGRYVFYAADFASMNRLLAFLTENCCAADGGGCGPSACAPSSSSRNTSRKVKA
jgi:DNA-binding transcriptional ArsR family regulator